MPQPGPLDPESLRLEEDRSRKANWKRWGPYLSDRQWGTVREDYGADGQPWTYFPHDHARSRAYRWGEDGLAGFSDRHGLICLAPALWNGRDPILKERLFGLSGPEGNHGEDAKEYWFHLDGTPTHSYMRMLYKYPQAEFPYRTLVEESARRSRLDPEFELLDSGAFEGSRYWDVFVTYAKASPGDLLVTIEAVNRGPDTAPLHVLPTIWFRNTWSWGLDARLPRLAAAEPPAGAAAIAVHHPYYGDRTLYIEGAPDLLFTDNITNARRLFGAENEGRFVKDAFHERVVHGAEDAVNPAGYGTKAAAWFRLDVPAGESRTVRLRLTDRSLAAPFGEEFGRVLAARRDESDAFYARVIPRGLSGDAKNVMRQSFAGMLWSKQYYGYDVARWLRGDPGQPPPPDERLRGRNAGWQNLFNADVLSMPDKWEYPWYAAWDLAFHAIPLALVDPEFAKGQLVLLLREWYMHPNGQLPAYEWKFEDVNPPVHAWAAWRVYKIDAKRSGRPDREFLARVFHKLLLNFTWWVNRKDQDGNNVFQGGFLGLDNIGLFDRSTPLPSGATLQQSDATSWMGMYCLNMGTIALELAREDKAYEDIASKFFEHFMHISKALNAPERGTGLWDETDGFFYDVLRLSDGHGIPMRIQSMVGLIPLFAVATLEPFVLEAFPGFRRRMQWFLDHGSAYGAKVETQSTVVGTRRLLSLVGRERLRRILDPLLDPDRFLSDHGIRSLSRAHRDHPFVVPWDGRELRVDYEPAESRTRLFGGNSNWRGPVWFPVNFLLIESLQKFHHFFGDSFTVEFPKGSGRELTLWQVADELSRRLTGIFLAGPDGRRPAYGGTGVFQTDPHWKDLLLFHEYFNGDDGAGLGASHQTGWTGLVAKLLQQTGDGRAE
ncbi:MAG TPA: glucosidase [Thermoanaerobaculia bacterium]|jgi:hypothetical protein